MASDAAAKKAGRRLASFEGLELWVPECSKGVGTLIGAPDSADLIEGVRVQPFSIHPDDRGYFLEVQRFGRGLAAAFPPESTQISAADRFDMPCASAGQGFTKGGGVHPVSDHELNRLHHGRLHASAFRVPTSSPYNRRGSCVRRNTCPLRSIPWASPWNRRGSTRRLSWWTSRIPACRTRSWNKPENRPAI